MSRRVTKDAEVAKASSSPAAAVSTKGTLPRMWETDFELGPSAADLARLLTAFARGKADFHALMQWVPPQVMALQGQCTTPQLAEIFAACGKLGI
eukprot:241636-Amphidinium_carterae.1